MLSSLVFFGNSAEKPLDPLRPFLVGNLVFGYLQIWLGWNQPVVHALPVPSASSYVEEDRAIAINLLALRRPDKRIERDCARRVDVNSLRRFEQLTRVESFGIVGNKHVAL